jgi:hypothetical protein
LESLFFEAVLDEGVDGMDLGFGRSLWSWWRESPVGLVFRALLDPSAENGFSGIGKHGFGAGRRHNFVRIGAEHPDNDLAGIGFPGNYGVFAGFAFADGSLAQIEAETAFASVFVHAVAFEAVLSEHGPYIAVEIEWGGIRWKEWNGEKCECGDLLCGERDETHGRDGVWLWGIRACFGY